MNRSPANTATVVTPDLSPERDVRFTHLSSIVGALLVVATGLIALLGCVFNLLPVKFLFANVTANEALCFVSCGTALFILNRYSDKFPTFLALCCAVFLGFVACTGAIEAARHLDVGLLQQLHASQGGHFVRAEPAFMAIQTSGSLILFAAGLLCIGSGKARLLEVSQCLALVVLVFALGAALNHIYDFPLFRSLAFCSPVHLPTACMLITAAVALYLSKPYCGSAAVFTSGTIGGVVARKLLPAWALTMAVFAILHFFKPELELQVFVMLVFFILPIMVWTAAAVLDKEALDKRMARADIQLLNQQLNSQVQELIASHRQINEALEARSEFLAKVSHELRTPLGGILSTTELLSTTVLTHEQKELTEITLESGRHLLNLINEILDFSKIDAHKIAIENLDLDLFAILTSALESLRAKAELKGLSLHSGLGSDVPRIIKGDPGRIRQVLINLIDNAIKFTHRGAVILQVNLHNQVGKQELLFLVKDSGIGIPVQFTDRLFQPFVQADGSITRRYGGSGLGLSICKSLVELMGGNIGLKSSMGEGAEFWFTLPLQRSSAALVPNKPTESLQAITETVKTNMILVVEDNPVNAKVAALQLSRLGYIADIAKNGKEAVDATARTAYDLVLMDVQMPEMDGLEATKLIRLRELCTEQHVPIVALTAHAMSCDREKCLSAGMQDYLTKPPTLAALSSAIKKWIPNSATHEGTPSLQAIVGAAEARSAMKGQAATATAIEAATALTSDAEMAMATVRASADS